MINDNRNEFGLDTLDVIFSSRSISSLHAEAVSKKPSLKRVRGHP